MPSRAEENAAWVADVSHNVAYGLQRLSCQQMAQNHGPDDLFGHRTSVRCSPPRLCSTGPDGVRKNDDDACTNLEEGNTTAKRGMPIGWERHFLEVHEDMRPGCATPLSAVVQFYAALLRRDGSHLAVLPPKETWDDRLQRKMEKHDRFFLRAVRVDGLSCMSDRCAYEVYITVSMSPTGEGSSGRDRGTARRVSDRWLIEYPPI